jgi:hypothetical protein
MSADADHEVIDSPEALFRHLYEAHGVQEALELDPETAPVQFWLRRHAELEREARPERRPEPAAAQRSERPGPGREGRRPATFGDPLVEAVARALAGRGHGEAAVRAAIRGYASPAGGGRTGEAALRGDLIEPMLRAAAERLLGAGQQPPPAERLPGAGQQPPPATRGPVEPGEPRRGGPAGRPEAAWAVFWADLADTAPHKGAAGTTGGADDDLMAVADAVQRRRRRRPAEREPGPRRR